MNKKDDLCWIEIDGEGTIKSGVCKDTDRVSITILKVGQITRIDISVKEPLTKEHND